jgi:menaquinone-dependent protoporphyrinogen IX oxidase
VSIALDNNALCKSCTTTKNKLDGSDRTYTPDFVDKHGTIYEIKPTALLRTRELQAKLQAAPQVKLVTDQELVRPTKPELIAMIDSGEVRIDPTKLKRVQNAK